MNTALENKPVPKLRFPEFRDDWKFRKIKNITSVKAGGTPSTLKKEYWNGEIPWMNSGELNLKRVFDVKNRITELGLKNSSTRLIPKGCVLIGLAGQGKTRGTAAINYISLCTNQSIAAIYPDKSFNTEFIYQNIDNRYGELRRLSTGEGGRGGLNLSIIGGFIVPIPSLNEQQKISEFLSSIDKKIQLLEKKKEQLELYKKGLMQKIFSQEIRFKDDNGNNYADWQERKLGDIGEFVSGNGFPSVEQGGKVGVPFIKVSDMNLEGNEFLISRSNNFVSEEQIARLKYKVINKASIIFAKVGAAIYLERKRIASNFLIDNNMMSFTPTENIILFKYLFDMIRLGKYAQVGALPSYNPSDLKTIKIKLPNDKQEQKKIADFLSSLDEKIGAAIAQLRKTKEFKKGLLQQMFI